MKKKWPNHLLNPDPEIYLSDNFVTVDFEWSTINGQGDPHDRDSALVLAQWKKHSSEDVQLVRGNEYELEALISDIEQSDYIVAHQSQGDLYWLSRGGWDFSTGPIADTGVAEYVYYGNLPQGRMASLEDCCKRRGMAGKSHLVSKLIKGGVSPEEIPASWLEQYGMRDVEITERLWLKQREELKENGLLPIFFTRCLFLPVLVDIEGRGMKLDSARTKRVYTKLTTKLNELSTQLDELTGGINWNSAPQRAEYVYDTLGFKIPRNNKGEVCETSNGLPKTDKFTMALLRPKTREQKKFLKLYKEAKHIKDQLSKNIDKFYLCCEENDGIIHFRYNNTQTATHRLSSSGKKYKAQGQNLPNDFKPLFTTRKRGWLIGEADESQLEYRVAVFLGDDSAGRSDITEGVDVHKLTAETIFREDWRPEEDSKSAHNKPLRQAAKPSTFKPLYGGTSGTNREQEYYRKFKEKHSGITAYQESCFTKVIDTKRLTLPTGLTFYWPDAKLSRWGKLSWPANSQVCDYPVQCMATADIVPIAVTYIWWEMKLRGMSAFMVNTIHDSCVVEIPKKEKALWDEIATEHMTDTVYWFLNKVFNIKFDVPLEAEVEFNTHWSDYPEWSDKWLS